MDDDDDDHDDDDDDHDDDDGDDETHPSPLSIVFSSSPLIHHNAQATVFKALY